MIRTILLLSLLTANPCSLLGQDDPAEKSEPIRVVAPTADEAIERRILEIFEAVGGFETIGVRVQSSVVTLTGEAPTSSVRADAVSLADRTDGVVLTLDRMTEPIEITSQFAPAIEKLREMGRTFVVKLPLIGAAIVVLLVTLFLVRLVNGDAKWLKRLRFSSLGRELARRVVRLAILVAGILIALELLDATAVVGAILGAAGLAGLALGFAFKNIVENYLAGVLLSTRNPFEIGDAVEIGGNQGKVARLTSRDTVLVTFDGNHLRIPNATVMNSVLVNFTRNPRRRFDFVVGVSTEGDLSEARKLGLTTIAKLPAILAEPESMAIIEQLADSSVVIRFYAWVDQGKYDFLKSKSEAIRLVKEAFDDAGIEMPEPTYRLNLPSGASVGEEGGTIGKLLEPSPSKPATERERSDDEVGDLTVDRAIDEQIEEESDQSDEENLLVPSNPKSPR